MAEIHRFPNTRSQQHSWRSLPRHTVSQVWPKVIALCMMIARVAAEGSMSVPPCVRRRGIQGGPMSYTPHIQVQYQLATHGELPTGRIVEIQDRPGGRASILIAPRESGIRLPSEITELSTHQIVHGTWRQRWTDDGRMRRPAQGLGLAVSRWERVPRRMLPSNRVTFGVEEDGSCIWLVDEDDCTRRLQNSMNDLLLRLAGDGLWLQCWFRRRPLAAGPDPDPLVLPPARPLALA